MTMFFLNARGEQRQKPVKIRAWVLAGSESAARQRVVRDLAMQSVTNLEVDACETTVRTDYFPPCDSLDAFDRAARDGAAYLFAPR